MRRMFFGLAVLWGLAALASEARAQVGGPATFTDPFFQYYSWYLPRQAALAAQPTTPQLINDVAVARQNFATQMDRRNLYGDVGELGADSDISPFSRGGERLPRMLGGHNAATTRGQGPSMYYNRTAQYFPGYRASVSANKNISNTHSARSGMGGIGGFGLPGGPG